MVQARETITTKTFRRLVVTDTFLLQPAKHALDDIALPAFWLARMKETSRARFHERFTWDQVLRECETLLLKWHPAK